MGSSGVGGSDRRVSATLREALWAMELEGLRDHVLPKLSVKVETDRVQCIPRQVSIQTPELTVSALVPMAKPDEAKPQS